MINLSGNDRIGETLLRLGDNCLFVRRITQAIVEPKFLFADLACMLLSNITKVMVNNEALQAYNDSVISNLLSDDLLTRLVDAFCQCRSFNKEAEFHFLASVFNNLCFSDRVCNYFLDADRAYPIKALMIFTEHPNLIRRGGVISTIKTLCMSADRHYQLLSEDEVNILPYILLPLAGPEELSEEDMEGMPDELQLLPETKTREADSNLRKRLLDALLCLCTTRQCREKMRERKVYPILREAHLNETCEQCANCIQDIVQLLMGEEEGDNKIVEMPVVEEEEETTEIIEALI